MEQTFQYKAPVKFGDTLHLELSVAEKKETSKPERGIVVFEARMFNQEAKAVLEGRWTLLLVRGG
jgi:acyl dehydratase